MKKIAIILAGCGSRDGSEIQEAVCTLLSISQLGGSYSCFAPDREQLDCINHTNGQALPDKRNLLVEAARIARGEIKELGHLKTADFDALIIPGGYGMAKNFSDFPVKGAEFAVDSQLKSIIRDFHACNKYIGAVCISPVLTAGAFAGSKISFTVTTGHGNQTAVEAVRKSGGTVEELNSCQICIDENNRLVTTPAYMNNTNLAEIYAGIHALVKHILQNC